MFNIFGSSKLESSDDSLKVTDNRQSTDELTKTISGVATDPINNAPQKGLLQRGWDWCWGVSDDTSNDKVNDVSQRTLLREPSGILISEDDLTDDDDDLTLPVNDKINSDEEDLTDDDDYLTDDDDDLTDDDDLVFYDFDDDSNFDPLLDRPDQQSGQLDTDTREQESNNNNAAVVEVRTRRRSNGFGPPGFDHWNPYGLTGEKLEEFQREIERLRQERIDNTEKDNRGWWGYLANLGAQLPGAGYFVRNGYARDWTKWALFGSTDFAALAVQMKRELRILTGDHKVARAIGFASPKMTELVIEKVIHSYPGFQEFIELENELLADVVKSLVLKAALNFAKNTKSKLGPEFEGDLTTQIFSDIMKIANEELDETSVARFEEIQKIRNINERKKQFRELFKPVADKFLAIALPNGQDDLELRSGLAGNVWNAVANEAIPDLFVKVFELTHKPPHHTEEDLEELERPGGAALKALAKFIAEKAKDIIPKAINKSGEDISKAVISALTDDETEVEWLKIWLKDRLNDICTTDDPSIKRIWDYVESNTESIIIHALANLGKNEDANNNNIVADVAGSGLQILEEFFTENKEAIDNAFEETASLAESERNERLNALFKPLSDKILEKADLQENAFVGLIKDKAFPAILRDFYRDMYLYQDDLTQDSEDLKDHLVDPIAHLNQAPDDLIEEYGQIITNPEEGRRVLWERSGIGEVVDALEDSCGLFAQDIIRIVQNFAVADKEIIAEKLNNGLFNNYPLNENEQNDLGEGLQEFFHAGGDSLGKTWDYAETVVKAALFKVFAAVAQNETVDGDEGRLQNKNTEIVGNVIHRVLSFLNQRIPAIDQQLQELNNNDEMDEHEKQLAIRELYKPLAEDFLSLAGDEIENILPVPQIVREPLKELLKTTLLPAIFHDLYTQLNAGREEAPENAEALDEIVPNGSNFVQSIADYIEGFVPYYMETNPHLISRIAMNAANKYVQPLSPELQNQIGDLVAKNVQQLGQDSEMAQASKAISEYSKALMLKMFGGIAKTINDKENEVDDKGENHFLLNTSIGFIKLMSEHVRRINKIPPEGRMYPAHIVPHKYMHQGFSDKEHYESNLLHEALAKDFDPGVTQEQKDQQRLEHFFVPFVDQILDIAGMNNPQALAVPEPLRNEIWGLFKTKIMPEVMMNVFKEVMKPETLNILMLKTFDALNEAVDELDEIGLDEIENEAQGAPDDELNEALGSLIKEMVELVPDFWTMTVFDSEKIKNMTSETLGKIVRRKLDDTTMIELLNMGLENFTMPEPGADRGKTEAQKAKENKRIQKELSKKMTAYISRQAKDKFKKYMKSKWDNFHDSFDAKVEKYLGKPGLAVKHFFDDILHFIFFDVLGPVFNFIVFKALWFFVDMKIAEKSKEIIKDVHMLIHENLVYKLCEEWVDSMQNTTQENVEQTRQELIEAFEQQQREREEAMRILEEQRLAQEAKNREETEKTTTEEILNQQLRLSQVITV